MAGAFMLSSALQKFLGLGYASGIKTLGTDFRVGRYTDSAASTRSSRMWKNKHLQVCRLGFRRGHSESGYAMWC